MTFRDTIENVIMLILLSATFIGLINYGIWIFQFIEFVTKHLIIYWN